MNASEPTLIEIEGASPFARDLYIDGGKIDGAECLIFGEDKILTFVSIDAILPLTQVAQTLSGRFTTVDISMHPCRSLQNFSFHIRASLQRNTAEFIISGPIINRRVYVDRGAEKTDNIANVYETAVYGLMPAHEETVTADETNSAAQEETIFSFDLSGDQLIWRVSAPLRLRENPTIAECAQTIVDFSNRLERTLTDACHGRRPDGVDVHINAPPHLRSAYLQYMSYFSQFLNDIGLEVETSSKETAGQVLFSVTPLTKKTTLDAIRRALDVYLALPTEIDVSDAALVPDGNLAATQLVAMVQHLQSQLDMVHAGAMAQKAQISFQQAEIDLYRDRIAAVSSTSITSNKKAQDEEQIFGGLVTIEELKVKGARINLPKLFRGMKRALKSD